MEQEQKQIWGRVESIVYQNADTGFAVVQISGEDGEVHDVVGPLAGCVPGEEVTLAGRFVEHSQYGPQFEATACVYRMPEEEHAILKYLESGILPGVGPATARRMVEAFGDETLEVLANEPEKLTAIRGFSIGKAQQASRRYKELFAVREAMSALSAFGLSAAEAIAVYRKFDVYTMDILRDNPYKLCGAPLYASFARADAISERLGLEKDSVERVQAAILYTLRHNLQNGHTCLPEQKLLATTAEFFSIPPGQVEQQLVALVQTGQLAAVSYGEGFVYLPDMLAAETDAALRVRALAAVRYQPPHHPEQMILARQAATGIEYAPKQREAILAALSHGVMVITGGPGTGKTTAINAIIALFEQQAERVGLAAPTGRAAKRMAELTGRKAHTLHRMLEAAYNPNASAPVFAKNAQNPLRYDVVVVDEMSMVDALLFNSLLCALKPGARLVLVGDADQLPSVGPGNVLKGILESGVVPVVALHEVFRQAAQSLIVSNAHRIVRGDVPVKGDKTDDYFFIRARGEECAQLVCGLAAQRLPGVYGYSPFADIQVLCPGRKGVLGTEAMNARLQELLNPPGAEKPQFGRGAAVFRLGDKVMQVKNNYDLPFTTLEGEPGAGAFNGDIGTIEELNPKTGALTVLCEDRHVYYSHENLRELELAYAVTIHKSQGSEFEAVVLVLAGVPQKLRYRNLLYTGVTRAKSLCVVAGEEEALLQMVANDKKNTRYSCFAALLRDEALK